MNTYYPNVQIKRIDPDPDFPLPSYAHDGDAAMDLCATEDVELRPGESCKMGCGFAFGLPEGYAGHVYPRSGLGNRGLVIKNSVGVIDSGYRGEVQLTLCNNNPCDVWVEVEHGIYELRANDEGTISIHRGDRVAQMEITHVCRPSLIETMVLDETDRGRDGLGSTGVR